MEVKKKLIEVLKDLVKRHQASPASVAAGAWEMDEMVSGHEAKCTQALFYDTHLFKGIPCEWE